MPKPRCLTHRVAPDHYLPIFNKEDDGCEAGGPSCLACPLPQCVLDLPNGGLNRLHTEQRHQYILKTMETEGLTVEEAAERFEVKVRTIRRMKQKAG